MPLLLLVEPVSSAGIEPHDQIVLAIIGLATLLVTALVYVVKANTHAKVAAEQATQTNDAVNHKEHGETRIFEQVRDMNAKMDNVLATQAKHESYWEDHHRRWGRLPEGLDDETGLVIALRDLRSEITQIREDLGAHVRWEEQVKWAALEGRIPDASQG
jgi:hypothetical protein